jgi:hypothetical protein
LSAPPDKPSGFDYGDNTIALVKYRIEADDGLGFYLSAYQEHPQPAEDTLAILRVEGDRLVLQHLRNLP